MLSKELSIQKANEESKNLPGLFKQAFCVSLQRREDRWKRFVKGLPEDWPFVPVKKFEAVSGQACPPPYWWQSSPGAWGCYRSHLRIIQNCLNQKIDSVLIFEDDAIFSNNFTQKTREFIAHLPPDWGMIYLGGEHKSRPIKINDWVYRCRNVIRTHAYGIRGDMLTRVYAHLCGNDWPYPHHLDFHLRRMQTKLPGIYCPNIWLAGQAAGTSDIGPRGSNSKNFFPSSDMVYKEGCKEASDISR